MIRIRDIALPPEHDPNQLLYEAAKLLRISASAIRQLRICRRSVDARKKPDVRIVYTVDVALNINERRVLRSCGCKRAGEARTEYYKCPAVAAAPDKRPVVVGFGPAGMFAALILARAGLRPLVLERGDDALTRHEKVEKFFKTGVLDEKSNVQFGEGGAGTFSDGKLNTGINNVRIGWVLEQLVEFGAQEQILYDAKPHIGTDVLLQVVQNLRRKVIELGGEVRFNSCVERLMVEDGRLAGAILSDGSTIACERMILAIGHSARDTFQMLLELGVPMEAKPFAMGVRIEQLQADINAAQYGADQPALPPADYKLVQHLEGRTVYTFCMCPGGQVVAAASEAGGVVTNGMSYSHRGGENANAALLVTVNPEDFPGEGPLAGMHWQRSIEQRAYELSGSYRAPAQLVGDFLSHRPSEGAGAVKPSYEPGVHWCGLHQVLPPVITRALEQALPLLDKKLARFACADAVLTAPETRSSSPVRIIRDEQKQSAVCGLYPAGEGAGYAGGIMSAAVDGIQCAEALIRSLEE